MVACGRLALYPGTVDVVTNPLVIVEVLSPSTERSDRGEKFAHYQRLVSLQEYVLVAQDAPRVEVFRRQGSSWLLPIFEAGTSLTLTSIGATFSVDELYADPRGP